MVDARNEPAGSFVSEGSKSGYKGENYGISRDCKGKMHVYMGRHSLFCSDGQEIRE